jgi:hypothetical protein
MTYRISGLDPVAFADTDALMADGAVRMTADRANAFPCRVTLEDADPGETMLLLNHISADVDTPFRASHAIFVREGASGAAHYRDSMPPLIDRRTTSLRAFDSAGMIREAVLVGPGEADAGVRGLLEDDAIDHVDIHTASWGCFLARAERSDG